MAHADVGCTDAHARDRVAHTLQTNTHCWPHLEVQEVSEVHARVIKLQGAAPLAVAQVVWERLALLRVLLCMEQQPQAPRLLCEEDVRVEKVPARQLNLQGGTAQVSGQQRIACGLDMF